MHEEAVFFLRHLIARFPPCAPPQLIFDNDSFRRNPRLIHDINDTAIDFPASVFSAPERRNRSVYQHHYDTTVRCSVFVCPTHSDMKPDGFGGFGPSFG